MQCSTSISYFSNSTSLYVTSGWFSLFAVPMQPIVEIQIPKHLEEEELRSSEEAGVNRVFVHRTVLTTPYGNGVRCQTTSPFARSINNISK